MKKVFKMTTAMIIAICLLSTVCGCSEEENPVYFYGVASYKTVGGENGIFAFVPIDTCGDVRIYENYTTLPEGLKEGDVIKMKFESAPEIRRVSVDDEVFLAFWPVPQEITIIASNVVIERTGSDYSMTIPKDKVENHSEQCEKISVCDDSGKRLYTFENIIVAGDKITLTVPLKDGHKALSMLEYRFSAENG